MKYTLYISFDQQFDPILINNSEFYKKLKWIQKYMWKKKRKAKSIHLKRQTNNIYFKISRQNRKLQKSLQTGIGIFESKNILK